MKTLKYSRKIVSSLFSARGFFLCFFILLSFQYSKSQVAEYVCEDGIFFENLPDTNNLSRYMYDNSIYCSGKTFTFDYEYIDANGKSKLFVTFPDGKGWDFVDNETQNDFAVSSIKMKILPDISSFYEHSPDYNQTVIQYSYITKNGIICSTTELTGIVENEKNIWMHPPRTFLFVILELNPFPYIHFPSVVGKQWEWNLEIGGFWGDKRWKIWDGIITNHYTYEIVEVDTVIITPMGKLVCSKIEAIAKSELGETSLVSYFNPDYGFVRLEYVNIDNSKICINCINVE